MSKNLTLLSSENVKVNIDSKSAERSSLLKGLLQDYTENTDIPLPEIKSDILKKCVDGGILVHSFKEVLPTFNEIFIGLVKQTAARKFDN